VRRLLRSYRLSPIGGGVALVLGAAILVLAVGPKHDEAPAFVVIVVVLALVCVRITPPWFRSADRIAQPTLEERREEFGPPERDAGAQLARSQLPDETEQDAAWAHERERYRRGE
jgi:hypothetical protein